MFKGPIYNYSQDFPFIWDEYNVLIRYGSDMEVTQDMILKVARETLAEYTAQSKEQWQKVVSKYYIEDAQVDPTITKTLTDNWIQFNLHWIVDHKNRRHTRHLLNEAFARGVEASNGKIVLASTTIEVVRVPEMKVDMNK